MKLGIDGFHLFWMIVTVFIGCSHALSRQQLKNSVKVFKKNCLAKIDVAPELVNDIDKGTFIEDGKVMCYVACIYQMLQIIKKDKLSYEASIKQVDMMYPPDIKDAVKATIDACGNVSKKYKDICEASFYTAKCLYEQNPSVWIFP